MDNINSNSIFETIDKIYEKLAILNAMVVCIHHAYNMYRVCASNILFSHFE